MIPKSKITQFLLFALFLHPWQICAQEVLNKDQLLLRDIFKELIETYTVNTIGNTTKADSAIVARLIKAGFPNGDIKNSGAESTTEIHLKITESGPPKG